MRTIGSWLGTLSLACGLACGLAGCGSQSGIETGMPKDTTYVPPPPVMPNPKAFVRKAPLPGKAAPAPAPAPAEAGEPKP